MNPKKIFSLIALVGIIMIIRYLDLPQYFDSIQLWIKSLGFWSPVLFLVLFTVTAGILLPMPILMVSAGVIYGLFWGVVTISIATLIQGFLLYLIAQKFKDKIQEAPIMNNKYSESVQAILINGGWSMICLLRCLPYMSFVFLSFMCGILNIKQKNYLLGTWLGMIPVSLMYVFVGVATKSSLDAAQSQSSYEQLIMYIGISAAVILTVFVSYRAKRILKQTNPTVQPIIEMS